MKFVRKMFDEFGSGFFMVDFEMILGLERDWDFIGDFELRF